MSFLNIVAIITAILISFTFIMSGSGKITKRDMSVAFKNKFHISNNLFNFIGSIEIAGSIGIILGLFNSLEWLGFAAAMTLNILMVGAIFYHFRYEDKFKEYVPAIVLLILNIIYIFAIANK